MPERLRDRNSSSVTAIGTVTSSTGRQMVPTTADLPAHESLAAWQPQNAPVRDLSAWLTAPRFALLLLVLIIAFFPEIVFGAKTFVFRDYALFGYPLAHYNREAFWLGEVPLWNPLNNCGIPYVARSE